MFDHRECSFIDKLNRNAVMEKEETIADRIFELTFALQESHNSKAS
jgi:hypothetical protein